MNTEARNSLAFAFAQASDAAQQVPDIDFPVWLFQFSAQLAQLATRELRANPKAFERCLVAFPGNPALERIKESMATKIIVPFKKDKTQ